MAHQAAHLLHRMGILDARVRAQPGHGPNARPARPERPRLLAAGRPRSARHGEPRMNALDEGALQAALDREAIHTVLMRYCRGVDRLDRDLIASVYHPDAYDHHGPSNM